MTPKEKAENLLHMYSRQASTNADFNHQSYTESEKINYSSIKNSLLCVRYILKALEPFESSLEYASKIKHWQEVKQELEKL